MTVPTPKEQGSPHPASNSGEPRGITIRRLGKKEATSPGGYSGAQGN